MKNQINFGILKKHINRVIQFILGITLVVSLSVGGIFLYHIEYVNNQMTYNIEEYDEVDREQLCRISDCVEVQYMRLHKDYVIDDKNHLVPSKELFENHNDYNILSNIFIDEDLNIKIFEIKSDSFYFMKTDILKEYVLMFVTFLLLSLMLFLIPLYYSVKEEQEESIILLAGSEALLANKSMINITENIHHELNTPLEVIDNKMEKIHRIINKVIIDEAKYTKDLDLVPADRIKRNKKLISLEEDFEFIKMSSEQIYSVLEKMKSFKHLRYSNGNKSLQDIIDGAFKIINISNTNFEYSIDEQLLNFSMDGMKNADFLSIMINHIKNSLEANADKILILLASHDDNYANLRIIDNGNGIPKDAVKKIFDPNYSTKATDSGIRGNGMYLNKHIMNVGGGDIKLINTSTKGTTFELKIKTNIRGK